MYLRKFWVLLFPVRFSGVSLMERSEFFILVFVCGVKAVRALVLGTRPCFVVVTC